MIKQLINFKSMKNLISKKQGLLIRMDDIAENMNWDLMNKCETLFNKYNIKPLLGVIPNNKDPELLSFNKENLFWEKVKTWSDKGWEICMHGYTHVYDTETNKKDFFNYGGRSEFFGHSLDEQKKRIKNGIDIFSSKDIKIRSFFAPNHTYDENTFAALKENGINYIVDGYGFFPYKKNSITFVPQLFYREIMLPYGVQATQIHLNYWDTKKFEEFEIFLEKNKNNILDFNQTILLAKNSNLSSVLNKSLELVLKVKRFAKS